ncbi:MAG: hypothetical protein ABIF40_04345 [archaeon]
MEKLEMEMLRLNETWEERERFREFQGRNIDVIPELLFSGRKPLSVADLMRRRIEVGEGKFSERVIAAWWDNEFDTCDGVIYHPDGKIKVVPSSEFFEMLSSKKYLKRYVKEQGSYLVDGAAKLTKYYEDINGIEFSEENYPTDDEVLLALVGNDINLLTSYREAIREQRERKGLSRDNDKIYVDLDSTDNPEYQFCPAGRLFRVSDGERSRIFGNCYLDNDFGRLIGECI